MSEPTKCCGNCKHWSIIDPADILPPGDDDMRHCAAPLEHSEGIKIGMSMCDFSCDQHEAAKELEDA